MRSSFRSRKQGGKLKERDGVSTAAAAAAGAAVVCAVLSLGDATNLDR